MTLNHPEVGSWSCEDCKRVLFDPRTGRIERDSSGNPRRRPAGLVTPCGVCPKCEHSVEKSPVAGMQRTLSRRNRLALRAYHELQACPGRTCDDLAGRVFGVIREEFDSHDRMQQSIIAQTILATAGKR